MWDIAIRVIKTETAGHRFHDYVTTDSIKKCYSKINFSNKQELIPRRLFTV